MDIGAESDSGSSDTDSDVDVDELEDRLASQSLEDVEFLPLIAAAPPEIDEDEEPPNEAALHGDDELPSSEAPQVADHTRAFVEKFTTGMAGAPADGRDVPLNVQYQNQLNDQHNVYEPFLSKTDWQFAHWAKTHSISATAVTDLLSLDGVRTHIGFTLIER